MAAGIVVRSIAPYLQGKDPDPAVVVVDEAGQFAVSLLSGHLGGANELARQVARDPGRHPGHHHRHRRAGAAGPGRCWRRRLGLTIENLAGVREVQMALLSGRPVRLVDPDGYLAPAPGRIPGAVSAGSRTWTRPWPAAGPTVYVGFQGAPLARWWLRAPAPEPGGRDGLPQGHPGRGNSRLHSTTPLKKAGLSLLSLKALATIAAKKEEPGLQEAARSLGVEFIWFTAEELEEIPVPHPSPQVARHLGVESVSEAAALKAGGVELIVPKRKAANATLAVARVAWRW